MKLATSVAVLSLAPVLALAVAGQEDAPTSERATSPVETFDWLEGSWECEIWGGTFVSTYTSPEGGTVLSASKLLIEGQARFFEFERFWSQGDAIWMTPHPGGEPKDPFELTEYEPEAKRAVFENPNNDFPTRIVYHRVSEDSLVVDLEDPHGDSGQSERFDFVPRGSKPATEER